MSHKVPRRIAENRTTQIVNNLLITDTPDSSETSDEMALDLRKPCPQPRFQRPESKNVTSPSTNALPSKTVTSLRKLEVCDWNQNTF